MERHICIHGHFYQPPRENPWLEAIELQDSAEPYHDWNERITAECYAPNGAARVLDGEGRIAKIVNNYARLSFNFGPTLLSWLETRAPDVYRGIVEADRESRGLFSGHGSALAQAYNHLILPLANRRDKYTQVVWGIRDFKHRFGRSPEGMWLPEAAVNLETLEILAEAGIQFTILAPHQAQRVRKLGSRTWRDATGGRIDPSMPYELRLPSGRSIALFFYDGPISRAVAFEGLLGNGEHFARRLVDGFAEERTWPQLVHIATDGETYGHHHRHGDMALAYALDYLESNQLARLTNYGEYLERRPATHEVEIIENSAWSCVHGIERWRSDCGCNSGLHAAWHQAWRAPLREALDWLRDALAPQYEARAQELVRDPWAARDDYIGLVLDRSSENLDRFLARHASRELAEMEKVTLLKLLEIQRHAMLMYTSCGWFFDELSGIETVQVLQYAGRAVQLAQEVFGSDVEPRFLDMLALAKSNLPEHRDGAHVYEQLVKPAIVDLRKVGAHYAVSSLFETYEDRDRIYCYTVDREDYRSFQSGRAQVAVGRIRVTSEITRESTGLSFGVLHFGDHNLTGGVREFRNLESYQMLVEEMAGAFTRADLSQVVRLLDRHFGEATYSLGSLFRDEQRKVLAPILASTMGDAEAVYRQVYEHQAPLMRFLQSLGAPLPKAFQTAAELVLNANLRRALASEDLDPEQVRRLLEEARQWQVAVDGPALSYAFKQTIERMVTEVRASPGKPALAQTLAAALDLLPLLPFEVDLWKAQNLYYEILREIDSDLSMALREDDEATQAWLDQLVALSGKLGVRDTDMQVKVNEITTAPVVAAIEEMGAGRRTPIATYRLQFNRAFTFGDARDLVPYLDDLGISDVYASPLLKPRTDSSHGYDIVDHGQLNPALGTERDFESLAEALRARDLGLILDTVPNHMGIEDAGNVWWMDLLENGPSSTFAHYFDVDWRPATLELENKVLLPILEDQYGKVLESGKLRLAYEDGAFFIYYYQTKLPVAPRTYADILGSQVGKLAETLGPQHEYVQELQSILTALSYLPERTETSPEKVAERNREKEIVKRRIAALAEASSDVRAAIDVALHAFNGRAGDPRSFDLLDVLLNAQAYRPAYWRVATDEINYRRFFDINQLAAIRIEVPEVFEATHRLIFRLLAEGKATGLRIDHPDGLWNPRAYFHGLQESYIRRQLHSRLPTVETTADTADQTRLERAIAAWFAGQSERGKTAPPRWPLYVVAEKILGDGEPLPHDWAVAGTTGYEFLNAVNGLFVDGRSRDALDEIYARFIGAPINFHNLANSTRKMIMLVSLASEINALSHQLECIAEKHRWYRDFTLNSLTFAIREVIAALPVYRTYITSDEGATVRDQAFVEAAVAEAKRRNPRTAESIFDFVRDTLLLRNLSDFPEAGRRELVDFVMDLQQITGPVIAKGVEDTAFYVYNRLVSLNEVGGNPEQFGVSVEAFHRQNLDRQHCWPLSLLATSTHDTKRSEDVRARIDVLSELPEEWEAALSRWSQLNAGKKTAIGGEAAPDRNDEYLFYQTLIGAWPLDPTPEELAAFRTRLAAYMLKATKEAKVHTSWVNANEAYDAAVQSFVQQVLAETSDDPFLDDFRAFQRRVAHFGQFNALAQVLLKLTSPGVPDLYQGTELWDFSLVDPDNRRPVDYQRRRALLAGLKSQIDAAGQEYRDLAEELLGSSADGRIKLYLTYRTLGFRRSHHQLFSQGGYVPVEAAGAKRDHVCAFVRALGSEAVLVVAPRLVSRLTEGIERPPLGAEVWQDTRLILPEEAAGRSYRNVFTGELLSVGEPAGKSCLPLADVLGRFPVALLERIAE